MKRGLLYSCARSHGYTKLVLAQHLDDIAESFFMSVFNNGLCRTMKANYEVDEGGLNVIRPLVYAREAMLTDYAREGRFPVVNENCPACFEEPKERARVKKLLSKEENFNATMFDSMRRALTPTMHQDFVGVCRSFEGEVMERGKKENRVRYTHNEKNEVVVSDVPFPMSQNQNQNQEEKEKGNGGGIFDQVSDEDLTKELARRKAARVISQRKGGAGAGAGAVGGGGKATCSIAGTCQIFE